MILAVIGLTAALELRSLYEPNDMDVTIIARDMPHDGLDSTGWASPWAVSSFVQLHGLAEDESSSDLCSIDLGSQLVSNGEQGTREQMGDDQLEQIQDGGAKGVYQSNDSSSSELYHVIVQTDDSIEP